MIQFLHGVLAEAYTFILDLVNQLGYLGIFLGMTIESSFFPFPSELILLPAGVLVAQGEMNFFLVLFAGLLGSVLGAWINYSIALLLGRTTIDLLVEKYGKFLFISKKSLQKTDKYFEQHGEITTFLGRLLFVIRQLVSLPAGFAKMNFFKFTLFTALGSGIWVAILIIIGWIFGSDANNALKIITGVILVLSATFLIIYYLIKKESEQS